MQKVLFNPIDKNYKSEIGGGLKGVPQTFSVKVAKTEYVEGIHFCVQPENRATYNMLMSKVEEDDNYVKYSVDFSFVEQGLYWYCFSYWNGYKTVYISKGILGTAELTDHPHKWQETVYEEGDTPDFFKGKVMYQIFPDRFARAGEIKVRKGGIFHENWYDTPNYLPDKYGKILNNDFFGGNFEGIISRLDYLKSLNVSIIYLNPIFEAQSNHKYDTGDFEKIDEAFGGEKAFKKLLKECKNRDIKVILDGVFNHVGENSKYFNKGKIYEEQGAHNSKDSKYHDWFTFLHYPDDYLCWWGIQLLPAVNENVPSYSDYIAGDGGIIEKYMKMGIDGFRLDVADELPDDFLAKIRDKIKEINPNGVVIGEVWEDASNKIAYAQRRKYFTENLLDGVMNYPWKDGIIDFIKTNKSRWLYSEIIEIVNNYPSKNLHENMNILSTHDTMRILTALNGEERGDRTRAQIANVKMSQEERRKGLEMVKMAALLCYTLPGTPCIYYGDEIGMEGYQDPFNRMGYDYKNADENLLEYYKTLGKIREDSAFIKGDITLDDFVEGVISFTRGGKFKTIVNLSNEEIVLQSPLKDLITGNVITSVKSSAFALLEL